MKYGDHETVDQDLCFDQVTVHLGYIIMKDIQHYNNIVHKTTRTQEGLMEEMTELCVKGFFH